MDASLQRSMSIRHCLGQWCTSSVYKTQVFWVPRSNVAEPFVRATWRFAPHCSTTFVSPITRFMRAATCSSTRPVPGALKSFWPPALLQQAPSAIILVALRRFRGPALFRGLRPSSSQGVPFWPSGLTLRSSGPAFCGPLTLAVRPKEP